MKKFVLSVALVLIAGSAVFMWVSSHKSQTRVAGATSAAPSPKANAQTPQTSTALAPLYEVPEGGSYQGLSDSRWQWWNSMMKLDRHFEWKMPIEFYGKVLDQNEEPVQGATVRFQWTDMSSHGVSENITESDSQGLFSLRGVRGKRLIVWSNKNGYQSEGGLGGKSFEYAAFFEANYHRASKDKPVIFRLTKKLGAEPLIAHHASVRASYSSPSYYDLEHGTLAQVASYAPALKFTIERSQSPQGHPFDWQWKIESVNGELQEITDEFGQLAPADAYRPRWETGRSAEAQRFEAGAHARLYMRATDNRYARVDIELSNPNQRDLGPRLTITSYLNPTPGSRNLEFDPKKQIKGE